MNRQDEYFPNPSASKIEVDLGIVHHFLNGVYVKQMHLPSGYCATSHIHEFDHLSVLAAGVAEVVTDEGSQWYSAPAVLTIKAGVVHKITAIRDVTWLCIHATDETDPDKVDDVLIKREV